VQASIAANTYVVSGHAETKKLQDLLPGIINQLGPDNLANLKKIAESYAPLLRASQTHSTYIAPVRSHPD
jgi:nascent polypeptide-associated complex subunit beta